MDKQNQIFVRQLARCPPSQVVPLLRGARLHHWGTIKDLCDQVVQNKIPNVKLPHASRRWFSGVVHGRHANLKNLRRSSLQRGGSKAELVGTAIKAIAKAVLPHMKKAGVAVAKQAVAEGISRGAEKLKSRPGKKKKEQQPQPQPGPSSVTKTAEDEQVLQILNEDL